jgi:hypothetical protein
MPEFDPKDVAADAQEPPLAPPIAPPLVPTPAPALVPPSSEIVTSRRQGNAPRLGAKATVAGALVVGGIAGAVILGPLTASAASPTLQTGATPSASADTDTGTGAGTDTDTDHGPGGHTEAVSDTSVIARAIGIREADLQTALSGGQTVAQVAAAHNVPAQTVIDALVADGNSELAADVASGKITQAQAHAEKAEVVQRATGQVNGTFSGGHGDTD